MIPKSKKLHEVRAVDESTVGNSLGEHLYNKGCDLASGESLSVINVQIREIVTCNDYVAILQSEMDTRGIELPDNSSRRFTKDTGSEPV